MRFKYTILVTLPDMFRHDSAIFREYTPSLKEIEVLWITFINCHVETHGVKILKLTKKCSLSPFS
jgi:hypothetical protein